MALKNENKSLERRDFLKIGAAAGAAALIQNRASASQDTSAFAEAPTAPPIDRVRIGFVGVGGMGSSHLRNLLHLEGVDIVAVCDIVEEKVVKAQDLVEASGQPRPTGYFKGELDFLRLCAEEDLTLVYTATPWEWHAQVCLAALASGKHAVTEVPLAVTLEDCWRLVESSEKHGKYCIMMENCCYGRTEMTVLNMVRQGVLGEIIHGECGYLHDIRDIFLQIAPGREWFQKHVLTRNGSLYTTHGIGPVAQCMNINRGDQFSYLVSMSSPALGLEAYAREKLPEEDPRRHLKFACGDVNTTLIQTRAGRSISVVFNTCNPRPYTRINLIQGLKGIVEGYPDRVYVEGSSPEHTWEDMEDYWERYEPVLWRELGKDLAGFGHGGMDYLEDYRLIKCLREGKRPDLDVYDGASWSCIAELSEKSVALKSAPIEIPDFTRGAWKSRPALPVPEA